MRKSVLELVLSVAGAAGILAATILAATSPITTSRVDARKLQQAVDQAVEFLQKAQAPDGSYASASGGPGVTAVVTTGLLRNGRGVNDPLVAKGLEYLEKQVKRDGGIYQAGSHFKNYETCLAMLCLSEANRGGRYAKILKAAEEFCRKDQWGEDESIDKDNPNYGGVGYDKQGKPRADLSNTQFLIEALRAAGDGPDDPALQKALIFVSRCQNHESQYNTLGFAAKNPDGGFYYTPAGGGQSPAGTVENGGLRSYGSMTYAGLKSMIYAGVGPNDPRVKAAFDWIKKHYDVQANPGMPQPDAGLYYYYHTFAKALDAMKLDTIEDARGVQHDWRTELAAEIVRHQKPDGSWINGNPRWLEGEPALVTGYALLTLSYCRPSAGK